MNKQKISRRRFLGKAAAGAASVGCLAALPAHAQEGHAVGEATSKWADLPREEMSAYAVVVGSGAAGLLAAYKLAAEGKAPLVIEKAGSSVASNFAVLSGPMAVETSVQKAAGITIATRKNVYEHMVEWSHGTADSKLLKSLLANSTEALETLVDLGLHFYTYYEYTGDPQYLDSLKWAPLHNITEVGADRIDPIVSAIEAAGGSFIYNCEGVELRMEGGKLAGVLAVRDGDTLLDISTGAVFLATGGFCGNPDMVRDWFHVTDYCNMGSTYNTGDGIRMAQEVGAVTERATTPIGNETCGSSVKHGPNMYDAEWNLNNENLCFAIYGGLVVDKHGDRFMNEDLLAYDPLVYAGQASMNNNTYYCIVDGDYYDACASEGIFKYLGEPEEWNFGREMFYPVISNAPTQLDAAIEEGWCYKADSLAEIAEHFGLENLETTVERYNEMCRTGEDADFGKDVAFLTEIQEGKGYYAFEYCGGYWTTLGGIRTDAALVAVDENNDPIPGVFVGGANMGSAFCRPYYDIPGSCCGLSIASGILAAKGIIDYLG